MVGLSALDLGGRGQDDREAVELDGGRVIVSVVVDIVVGVEVPLLGDLVAVGGGPGKPGLSVVHRVDRHWDGLPLQDRVGDGGEVDGIVGVGADDARAGQEEPEGVIHRAADVLVVLLGGKDVVENQGVTRRNEVEFEDGRVVRVERAQRREVRVPSPEVASAESSSACVVGSDGHVDVACGQHDAVEDGDVGRVGVEAADLVEVTAEGDVADLHPFTEQVVDQGLLRGDGVVRDKLGARSGGRKQQGKEDEGLGVVQNPIVEHGGTRNLNQGRAGRRLTCAHAGVDTGA